MPIYQLTDLQTVEPEFLPEAYNIEVIVQQELDGMGFNEVTLRSPDREALLDYVRQNYLDESEDADWFRDYVVARIGQFPDDGWAEGAS